MRSLPGWSMSLLCVAISLVPLVLTGCSIDNNEVDVATTTQSGRFLLAATTTFTRTSSTVTRTSSTRSTSSVSSSKTTARTISSSRTTTTRSTISSSKTTTTRSTISSSKTTTTRRTISSSRTTTTRSTSSSSKTTTRTISSSRTTTTRSTISSSKTTTTRSTSSLSSTSISSTSRTTTSKTTSTTQTTTATALRITFSEKPIQESVANAAQFLIQATFGPTKQTLNELLGRNFQTWILNQIQLPVESHRAFYRSRVNSRVLGNTGAGIPKHVCSKGSRWHNSVFTIADIGKPVVVSNRRITVDGVFRSDIDPARTGNGLGAPADSCSDVAPSWWKSSCAASSLRSQCTFTSSKGWADTQQFCQKSCYDQGYPYPGLDCSMDWTTLSFNGFICGVTDGVGGFLQLSTLQTCRSFFNGTLNPAIYLATSNQATDTSLSFTTMKPGVLLLSNDSPNCGLGTYVRVAGKIYRRDQRLELLTNSLESPAAVPSAATCPSVAKTFLNEKSCVLKQTCAPLAMTKTSFTLNSSTIGTMFTAAGAYVYYITDLVNTASPCNTVSRWKRLDCKVDTCTQTAGLSNSDLSLVQGAMNGQGGGLLVDAIIRCQAVPANAVVAVNGTTYYQNIHPNEFNVYDFSDWATLHPGGPDTIAQWATGKFQLKYPGSHSMERWSAGSTQRALSLVGRLGDTIDFQELPPSLYIQAIANAISPAKSAQAYFQACGSPNEVANNPMLGNQFSFITYYPTGSTLTSDLGFEDAVPNNQASLTRGNIWLQQAFLAKDQLRQRMAWALNQIFVIGTTGLGLLPDAEAWTVYYDIFVRNGLGNFRNVLREVTYSPMMATYLTYLRSSSFDASGNYPDENYAREIMQLFTIGIWKLNPDGSETKDSQGQSIPTYDNDHVMNFARVFTGFDLQMLRANIEVPLGSRNNIDPLQMLAKKHDMYPKPDLDGNYLGDFYPLCSDLPSNAFLQKGATFAFIGYSYGGTNAFLVKSGSPLYAALCRSSTTVCSFALTVSLPSTLSCFGQECLLGLQSVFQVGNGYYQYKPPTCVNLFFVNGQSSILGNSVVSASSQRCRDPATQVASVSCCKQGCTDRAGTSVIADTGFCANTTLNLTRLCAKNSGWASGKFCQYSCWKAGNGYVGDNCSSGLYAEARICAYQQQLVDHATAVALCRAQGFSVCPTRTTDTAQCNIGWGPVWLPNNCTFNVSIDASGMVSSQIDAKASLNFFSVRWDGGGYPKPGACPSNCISQTTSCLCPVLVEMRQVFTSVPGVADLKARLFIGAIKPTSTCSVNCNGQVKAYFAGSGKFDQQTVFEYAGKFYKNQDSIVRVSSGFFFRNPPSFMDRTNPTSDAALAEVEALLDHLFNHPNVAPFVSQQLIQRFTTSNPSLRYVADVVQAFRSGSYNGTTFSGKYGDLAATVSAILLHPEARGSVVSTDNGAFREPLVKLVHFLRSMEYTDPKARMVILQELSELIGQYPFEAPNVFGFFQPDFQPLSFQNSTKVAPEFQIFTPPYAATLMNGLMSVIDNGLSTCNNGFGLSGNPCIQGRLAYNGSSSNFQISDLDILLTGGRLNNSQVIRTAIAQTASSANKSELMKVAQRVIVLSPEFHTLGKPQIVGPRPAAPAPPPVAASRSYKAVITLFLGGGADTFNLLVPLNCDLYGQYMTVRQAVGLQQFQLHSVKVTGQACANFGIHYGLPTLKTLYDEGSAAFISNVGALVKPMNKDQYKSGSVPKCSGLFSHEIQRNAAQTLKCQEPGSNPKGAGGRMADALSSGSQKFKTTSFSIAGTSTWSQGLRTNQAIIDARRGAVPFNQFTNLQGVLQNISSVKYGNIYCDEYIQQMNDAVSSSNNLGSLLANVTLKTNFQVNSGLDRQFQQVANLISTRQARGAERDFFFVSMEGYDTHADSGAALMTNFGIVDAAIKSFVAEMKAQGIWESVVVVSSSDFGRTMTPNDLGTDHGWAGQHFVVGGSVKGGNVLNKYPASLVPGNGQDIGRGRMIPTYPWESMIIPVAQWMGVDSSQMPSVFPNLANFNSTYIIPQTTLFAK